MKKFVGEDKPNLDKRYWYLRNILTKCIVDEDDDISKIREEIGGKHPISVHSWIDGYKTYEVKYGRPMDHLSESESSESESD